MPTPVSKPTVLVVDDDEGLLILMADVMREEGCEVVTAPSAAEAVKRLQEDTPDLMVLDLKLKDLSGADLIETLRAVAPTIPFLVVTGQGDERIAVDIMKQGAVDYVMKDSALLDLLPSVIDRAWTAIVRERELTAAGQERRRLEREVLEAGEREQYRIGADLHDGLGQQLTAIELMCASLKADLVAREPDLVPQVELIGRFLRETISQTRAMARGLVPVKDEPEALWVSLTELADTTNRLGLLSCQLDCPAPVLVENNVTAGHLYRIAQEAVNNALKHSGAKIVVISLERSVDALQLRIVDDGRGLSDRKGAGVGLRVMKHRAEVIGAKLMVESRPDRGLIVTCTLPMTS